MARRAAAAVKQAVQKLTAWSYSRWTDYEKCAFLAKCKHVLRMREPDNPAMQNGTIVHQLGAQFVTGALKAMPPEFKNLSEELRMLKQQKAATEQEWAFDVAWQPVDWFSKAAWARIKVDAHYLLQAQLGKGRVATTVVIVDYKTGRNKPDHAQQRSLYALGGFAQFPDATKVIAQHWYTDTGEIESQEFVRKDFAVLLRQWEQRTRAMMADTTFAPRPGTHCRWCHFRKNNGGPCQF